MKKLIRKTPVLIGNVTYESGDYSNNLHARDFATEIIGKTMILSFDLSPSQADGSEASNGFEDAEVLKREFTKVRFIQLDRDNWLEEGLLAAVRDASQLEVQMTFKDGTVRRIPVTLDLKDEHAFWLNATKD
jgi:hypothetical protein